VIVRKIRVVKVHVRRVVARKIRKIRRVAHIKIIKQEVRRKVVPRKYLVKIVQQRKRQHKIVQRKRIIRKQVRKIRKHYRIVLQKKITVIRQQNKVITPAVQQQIRRIKKHYKQVISKKIKIFKVQATPKKVVVTKCAKRALRRFSKKAAVKKCGSSKSCRRTYVKKSLKENKTLEELL